MNADEGVRRRARSARENPKVGEVRHHDRTSGGAGGLARSFALAHELGHVLLAMPGHPDDFGVDKSWSLMDADVAEPTIFGPRRLSFEECARAVKQAGPGALVPLLSPATKAAR